MVRGLTYAGGLDFSAPYRRQNTVKLGKLLVAVSLCPAPRDLANSNQAREAEPYLARFQDD